MTKYVRDYSRPSHGLDYTLVPDTSPEGQAFIFGRQGDHGGLYNIHDQLIESAGPWKSPTESAPPASATSYNSTLSDYMARNVTNPGLPPGTEFVYNPIQEQSNEMLQDQDIGNVAPTQAEQGQAGQIDPNAVPGVNPQSGQYDAATTTSAQGQVTPEMTVQGQLAKLYKDFENGQIPPWASGAARIANEAVNSRGMAASTLAGMSIAQAIMEAAFPIAQFDAKVYDDQAFLNQRNAQEALLSNQAAENAARQFGAASQKEVEMFMSTMAKQIQEFNATQKSAMEQFNAGQENSMTQFYQTLNDKRDQFNATMALEIQKSNAEWRRQINLANTAGKNAETLTNVQNRYNLSMQALANLWQEARDVFQWAQVSAENDESRAFQLTLYQLQRTNALSDRSHEEQQQLANYLGGVANNVIKNIDFNNLFSSGRTTVGNIGGLTQIGDPGAS